MLRALNKNFLPHLLRMDKQPSIWQLRKVTGRLCLSSSESKGKADPSHQGPKTFSSLNTPRAMMSSPWAAAPSLQVLWDDDGLTWTGFPHLVEFRAAPPCCPDDHRITILENYHRKPDNSVREWKIVTSIGNPSRASH